MRTRFTVRNHPHPNPLPEYQERGPESLAGETHLADVEGRSFDPARDGKAAAALGGALGFWLLVGLIALFAGGKAILFDTIDPDCFWHLRVAEQLQHDGIGPIVDDLSFASQRQAWTPYSWLAELGMKGVWDLGGYRAAVACAAILQAGIIVLLAGCCLEMQGKKKRYLLAAGATALGAFLILPYLSFRPVTIGFVVLFGIAWMVLRDFSRGREPRSFSGESLGKTGASAPGYQEFHRGWLVWCIVPLTVLMTNIHLFSFLVPGFLLALAMGAALEGNRRQFTRYSLLSTLTLLACLATPMLPGLVKTIVFYSSGDKMVAGPVIAEMQSFARGPFGWVSAIGVGAVLLMMVLRFRLLPAGMLICVAVAFLLMLKLGRFAPIFALVACPAFAVVGPSLKDRLLGKPVVVLALAMVLVIGLAKVTITFPARSVSLSAWVNRNGPGTPGYPCAAADFVDRSVERSSGRLINEFSWGGYLAWRLDGKYRVLLDGRTQVYPPALWKATYLGSDDDRSRFLARSDADAALVPTGNSKFRSNLMQLGWSSVYKDDRAEVLLPPGHVARIE